eukprot:12026246-Alexandrium_andersonii.AAC.1
MSASLVGSEMCIRDSQPSSGPCPRDAPKVYSRSSSSAPGSSPRVGRPPVSYTHLTLPTICSV